MLGNGKVLVVGGYDGADFLASAELYDPVADTFAATGDMSATRSGHTATLLGDGTVLLAGGGGDSHIFLASAELYDPAAGTFAVIGSMTVGRERHTATLLPNGKVLVAGAYGGDGSAELYP